MKKASDDGRRDIRAGLLALLLVLGLTGCQRKEESAAAPPAMLPPSGAVDASRSKSAEADTANWRTHGRTYSEQRFSPLKAIDTHNITRLSLAWYLDFGPGERGQASTPLVVDGVMYVTTSWSRVLAVNAGTGRVLWRFDPKVPGDWGINACCDVVNRGAAYWEGKIYVGTLDGRLVALNAADGRPLWQTLVIDRSERASITGAPRVIKGRVFIGSAGGEMGVRGRLTAVNANTGAILWRFFTVPGDPSVAPENRHLTSAQPTWSGQWWKRGGGGTVWDAMSYDPVLDLLYIGTGNGSPWPQSVRSPQGGDNLYVSSILALRAETGELTWSYQTTPGDEWGFDAASQLVLTELTIARQRRPVLLQAAANGFVYVLDRATGQLISATAFVPVTWATGVDLTTGRPQENPAARYSRTGKPFVVQPGPPGAHSWHSMAFDPMNGLLYIPAMLNAAELSVDKDAPLGRYALTSATAFRRPEGSAPDASRLIAWDPVNQKAMWSLDRATPVASGVLATAGSLVFQGSTNGTLEVLSADTGKSLWKFDAGTSITAAPITYEAAGTQMVSVVAGAGGRQLLEGGRAAASHVPAHNTPRLLAFSLNGTAQLPAAAPAGSLPFQTPATFGTSAQVGSGKTLYERYCARCHGEGTINAGPLKDLKQSQLLADAPQWRRVVYAGLLRSAGMPGFMVELSSKDAEALRAYVVECAHDADTATATDVPRTAGE
jgi:quinohemoprotein ethanol dehydrogenase